MVEHRVAPVRSRYSVTVGLLTFFTRGRRARRLYDEARELIDAGVFEDALTIARKLRKLSYSGAFEIEGLAYAGLARHEDAVRVLREGLAQAPHVWLNWHLLGNCLSDLSRFDEALAAFDRAAACSGADRSLIDLNRAIVEGRRQNHARSLAILDDVHGDAVRLPAISTRISALRGLQRDDEALALAEAALRAWSDGDEKAIGSIAFAYGELRRSRGDNPLAIRTAAIDHWRWTHDKNLLWLIRDVLPVRSDSARYWRLTLCAEELGATVDANGFFVGVDVVADSVEEALEFARQLDEFDGAADLRVDEAHDLGPHPNEPKGVYAMRGRVYYREDAT